MQAFFHFDISSIVDTIQVVARFFALETSQDMPIVIK
jgi:hypothetical protein